MATNETAGLGRPGRAAAAGEAGGRIELGNRLLAAHRYGSPEHERGLALLRAAAEEEGGVEAQWMLGAYYLQVSVRPGAHAQAAHWLERAAAGGVPAAIDRLADLHLSGLGTERSLPRALELQQRLADAGFPQAAWDVGYLAAQPEAGVPQRVAATAFARACALGYPPAYYSLGLRYAAGHGVERDIVFGCALLRRAADADVPDAREAADALAPAGADTQAVQRWYLALKASLDAAHPLLDRLHQHASPATGEVHPQVPRLEAHLASIGHPSLRLNGAGRLSLVPSLAAAIEPAAARWDWLSQAPRVAVARDFATREECSYLMFKSAAALGDARSYRRAGGNDDGELELFSGSGRPVDAMRSDVVVRVLERRIATMTQWGGAALEPCSIIRYRPGQQYRPHVDFFTDQQIAQNRAVRSDPGGQRVATFLLYLHAPREGGETVYHHSQTQVRGERGMGVLHYNVTPDGRPDPASLHSGLPVARGEKWLWRSTLREHPLYG